jgi:hypothetical protein
MKKSWRKISGGYIIVLYIIPSLFYILVCDFLETSSESGWLASVNESIGEFECIPSISCENWRLKENKKLDFASSLDITVAEHFDLLKTRPWNCN